MRALLGVALPILTIATFVILLAFSLTRLSEVERDMRIEATQNMLWVISRAHVSSLQLGEAAARHAIGEIDQSELELRYNVFLSRLALLDDGPQRRHMDALGFGAVLDDLLQKLPELGSVIADLEPDDRQLVRVLLEPYSTMLNQAANKAMVAEWDDLGVKLDTSRNQLGQIIVSLIGISLAGAVLCGHFVLAIRDARRRARLLDKEKAFSELLIGSSGEGIVAVDLQRHCTVWNEAAERLFGLPASGAIGNILGDVSGFFQIDRIANAVGDAFDGRSVALFDQPFFPPGQVEPLYVDLRCFSLRAGDHIVGAILLVTDVTERRAAQREIADHRDHLEQLVQARTQELDAALTRERATAELYRNFGTMISHQFRTPLAIVDSALQRLMRRSDRLEPAEVLERGGNARHAIARLTRLVGSTLDAARLDAGQIDICSQPCDLGSLAADICVGQSKQTPEWEITVDIPNGRPVMACCDPVHAENILVNLLSNAVKYSQKGTAITVAVATAGAQAECRISNYGTIGCPTERDALFERYVRGSNAEGQPGIGIGLYMARTLARMQGGDVQLDADNGDRITFTLSLPLANAPMGKNDALSKLSETA
ncbi:ATP-binding protein [Aquamicrobium segne]|uniref:histidine kinase n=1 Tax=Aquamicrobium segne TaxID=469547 RepID=A0ABW0H0M4_9HYPH